MKWQKVTESSTIITGFELLTIEVKKGRLATRLSSKEQRFYEVDHWVARIMHIDLY